MTPLVSDPVQSLALLPLGQSEVLERRWLQDTLAWLKDVPPELRTERLRHLAEGIRAQSGSTERFQQIWRKAFASRVFAEAGLAEATSLARELLARIKGRLLPELEDELDLYAALQMADLDDADAQWLAELPDADAAAWRELLGASSADLPVAIRLLALRAASIGLSPGVMKVMPHRYETESPFYGLIEAASSFTSAAGRPEDRRRLGEILAGCRGSAGHSHARMEENGVSSIWCFGSTWCLPNWTGSTYWRELCARKKMAGALPPC
jgi:site-specific recombinase